MKKILRISVLAILLISIFASMAVFAEDCGHVEAYTQYSNSGKWAKARTEREDIKQVSAYVYGTYRMTNDYTSYSFSDTIRRYGNGSANSTWEYKYSSAITFTLVNNSWTCYCGGYDVA